MILGGRKIIWRMFKKAVDDLSAERGSLMVKDMVTEEFYIKVAYSAKPEDKLKKKL